MSQEKDDEVLLTVALDEGKTEERLKAIKAQLDFYRDAVKVEISVKLTT